MTNRPELTQEWINRKVRESRVFGIVNKDLGLVPNKIVMRDDETTFDVVIPCEPLSGSKDNPLATLSLQDATTKLSAAMSAAVNAENEPLDYKLGKLEIDRPQITHPALTG